MGSLNVILLVSVMIAFVMAVEEHWCYKPSKCPRPEGQWEGDCENGTKQSPVNLDDRKIRYFEPFAVSRTRLTFNDKYSPESFYILDNGDTVQVRLTEKATSDAELTGDGLNGKYKLAQLHFHWGDDIKNGAEHLIRGIQYSMEAHFVHYSAKYDSLVSAIQSGDSKGVAVISVLLDVSDTPDKRAEETLKKIAGNIPTYDETPTKIDQKLDLYSLLPTKGDKIFQYSGSLTTPKCQEVVAWNVKKSPVKVSSDSVMKFLSAKGINGETYGRNYRKVKRTLHLDSTTTS